ncbi:MAG TPA: hypothetical protein VHZ26_13695 [Caulobacteraceae bacterium]|nr:hypothetical protein [Caulobacteraceae bacterium]
MWKPLERKWIADRVAQVKDARRRQGHELRRLQQGIVEAIAAWDPKHEPASRKELDLIKSAVEETGQWKGQEEWRIMTWFDSSIVRSARDNKIVYEVAVECDGQRLACNCPTVEGAYAFMRLYQAMIVDQFYTIGPPWADTGIFKT